MAIRFISEQALAETYDAETGWETVTQYREATQLREQNPEMARTEIARRVGRSSSTVRGWLAEGKTPSVVAAIQTAQERGWIDVPPDSEQFRALNQLVAWIYSGGGIQSDTFVPYFSVDDSLLLGTLSHLLRWTQIEYRCRDQDDSTGHIEVVPTDHGALLGRVLSILGAPRGRKSQLDELSLPSYFDSVDRCHRRDFARIYLLNRGGDPTTSETDGTYVHQVPGSSEYSYDIKDLFESITEATATVGNPDRVWVSAAAVRELAHHHNPLRPALATASLYGTITPPTDQAVASTFRQADTPRGYPYHQLYQAVRERDGSRAAIAREVGLPETTIQSWMYGSRPPVTNTLARAAEADWLSPPTDSATALSLIALFTWVIARGGLRNTYYPVFRANTPAQCERFDTIASILGFSYGTARDDDPAAATEFRLSEEGTTLGRILYALGVPRRGEPNSKTVLPPIVYLSPAYAQQVADIWWLHHARTTDDAEAILSIPSGLSKQFSSALMTLLSDRLSWSVYEETPQKLVIRDRPTDNTL